MTEIDEQRQACAALAAEHWKYVESVLLAHNTAQEIISIAEFHYKASFIHGFKHGVQSVFK